MAGAHIAPQKKASPLNVALGVIGELFITVAILLIGFAFWQLARARHHKCW